MNEIQSILTERVDDLPLLLEQMQRMNLPTLIDQHFPTHGNWQGLSLGWVSTIWLSSILSRGDHRLVQLGEKKNPFCGRPSWHIMTPYAQTTLPEE
jgi:transposase